MLPTDWDDVPTFLKLKKIEKKEGGTDLLGSRGHPPTVML